MRTSQQATLSLERFVRDSVLARSAPGWAAFVHKLFARMHGRHGVTVVGGRQGGSSRVCRAAEVLDKSESGAAPSEEVAAMDATPAAIPVSPISVEVAPEDDPDGPAPMAAEDTDPAAEAGDAAAASGTAATAVSRGRAQDGVTPASAAGLGGIRGSSADVQRDYSDPSVNIQGELRELSDIAGLRSPMGGLLADPERLLQSQSWWTIATAGGAGDPTALKPESQKEGTPHAGAPGRGDAARDADGGQDAARLARQRKVGSLPPACAVRAARACGTRAGRYACIAGGV